MSTLTVSQTTNYARFILANIDTIDFTNSLLSPTTASFSASQFMTGKISPTVLIDGSTGFNGITVSSSTSVASNLDASGWTFANWSITDKITINGSALADTLIGSSKADTILGGDGNDVITGGAGRDHLLGGAGNDKFLLIDPDGVDSGEVIDGGAGTQDTLVFNAPVAAEFDLRDATSVDGIERLILKGDVSVIFDLLQNPGNTIANIQGDQGLNILKFIGTSVDLTAVTFTGWSNTQDLLYIFGDAFAQATLTGSTMADTIIAGGNDDTISGGDGNDVIRGNLGMDTLSGGAGADTFLYAAPNDIASGEVANGGSGTDTLTTGQNDTYLFYMMTLSSIEQLGFGAAGGLAMFSGGQIGQGAGTIAQVAGNSGGDILMVTGNAVDLSSVTFSQWSANDQIIITGSDSADSTLTGSAFADLIEGGALNDTIAGGAGADQLDGGGGINTLSYQGDTTGVTVNLKLNTASGGTAAGDTIGGFQNVTGGSGNDTLTGSDAANTIQGGAGDDIISGGLGSDALRGGGGNDVFAYNLVSEIGASEVIDGGNGSLDKILIGTDSSNSWQFQSLQVSGVEVVQFSAATSAIFNETQVGGAGGIGTVIGAAGQNLLAVFGSLIDVSAVVLSNWQADDFFYILGTPGDNTITGSSGKDLIGGDAGADIISGGGGTDTVNGGAGKDILTGGTDADLFQFSGVFDSAIGASRDRVTDFSQGSDRVDLSEMDAITGGADNAFTFIGTQALTAAGQLRAFLNANGNTIIEGDVNGGGADFQIQLDGNHTLQAADFLL